MRLVCKAVAHDPITLFWLSIGAILGYRGDMRPLAVTVLFAALATPAAAAATAWQQLEPGTRVRMIAGEVLRADGTTMVGIQLDMPPTTKTYWRVPGETGIPARFEFTAADTGVEHRVLWPYPQVDVAAGYTDYVYYGPTVLPVEVAVDDETKLLRVAVTIGVCSDICMPVDARFELPLDFAEPDRGQSLRIAQAAARAPIAWDDPRPALGEVTFDAAAGALLVHVLDPVIDPLSVIADAGTGGPLFGAPQKSPDGTLVRLPLLGEEGKDDLQGRSIRLTFMTPAGPFEVSRRLAPSTSDQL